MPNQPYCPKDGDFIWIDFNPQAGSEQAGRRPAFVLSPETYNRKVGLCVLCPVTGRAKNYPFEVAIPSDLAIAGVVLADQVKSMSWKARNASFACDSPRSLRSEVRAKLKALLMF